MTNGARAYAVLEERLGHTFADPSLCEAALTHKSWLNEAQSSGRTDNERLEFLGDAVLALVVSDLLMRNFPARSEGELSKTRAAIVREGGGGRARGGGDRPWRLDLPRPRRRSGRRPAQAVDPGRRAGGVDRRRLP